MNRDSNGYTFLFAGILVLVVAASLAFTATSLKERQSDNVRKEKMQNILATIGIEIDRDGAENLYNKYIKEELSLNGKGESNKDVNAFKIELNTEVKKDIKDQFFPLFVADVKGETYYIIPLRGAGLWNAIWGYISLEKDLNTIKGVVFDHVGETAGLGAEITQSWFQKRFVGEKIADENGILKGIEVSKTNNDPQGKNKDDHKVDAISGATITGDGVTKMIFERLGHYTTYINSKLEKGKAEEVQIEEEITTTVEE